MNNGKLTTQEHEYIATYLASNKAEILAALQDLTPGQWGFRPHEQAWTLAEIAEHLALAERGLLRAVQKVMAMPADPARRAEIQVTYEDIVRRTTDRTSVVEAPERVVPTGKFPDGMAALLDFTQQRETALTLLEQSIDLPLHDHFGSHPTLGTLDSSQLLVFMAAHCQRHLGQIAEIKASPLFPS